MRSARCHSQVDSIYDDLNDASEGGNESASSEGSLGQMTSEFEKALHDELEESRALVSDVVQFEESLQNAILAFLRP